jgi:hypothetical protein
MKDDERAAIALTCASFLYLNDFISGSVYTRIHQNIGKYLKKNKVSISDELLDCVNIKIDVDKYLNESDISTKA